MKERITKLQQQWEYLVQKSSEKSQHLKESNQQQQFNTNVKELDFWLGEVRESKILLLRMDCLPLSDCICWRFVFLGEEDLGVVFIMWVRKGYLTFVLNLERATQDCKVVVVFCPSKSHFPKSGNKESTPRLL